MTLSDITKALDGAVAYVSQKKTAADAAKKASDLAAAEYHAAISKVKELHTEYTNQMSQVLSGFGQIHK